MDVPAQTPGIQKWGVVAGRVLLASLFILGGVNKIANYAATLEQMEGAGLPLAGLLLPVVVLLELCGGLLVAFAGRGFRYAALALAGFTVLTNIVFHDFWNISGEIRQLELSLFFKNISIAGGLIFLACHR